MPPRKVRAKNEKYLRSGQLIAEARHAEELTQDELAAQLGITRQRLQNWEKGVAMPRPAEMEQLAKALKLTIDEIARGDRAAPQQALELDASAQAVAGIWASIPPSAQSYIADQLHSMFKFHQDHPEMAARVFKEPASPKEVARRQEHEKMLVLLQEISRRKPVKE